MSMIQVSVTDYVQDPTRPGKLMPQTRLRTVEAPASAEAAPTESRRASVEPPASAQARADFKSLAGALQPFEPVRRNTRSLVRAAQTGSLLNGEA